MVWYLGDRRPDMSQKLINLPVVHEAPVENRREGGLGLISHGQQAGLF